MNLPFTLPISFVLLINSESSFSFPASKVNVILPPMLVPFILKIQAVRLKSVPRINSKEWKRQYNPCLTPRCIRSSCDNSFMIRPEAVKGALYRIWCGVSRLGDNSAFVISAG